MDEIRTDKGCRACGDQIRLVVETPGVESVTDPLQRLLGVGADQRVLVIAECGCDRPRVTALQGDLMFENEFGQFFERENR